MNLSLDSFRLLFGISNIKDNVVSQLPQSRNDLNYTDQQV